MPVVERLVVGVRRARERRHHQGRGRRRRPRRRRDDRQRRVGRRRRPGDARCRRRPRRRATWRCTGGASRARCNTTCATTTSCARSRTTSSSDATPRTTRASLPDALCVDPGIGFGKLTEHNLALLAHLDAIARDVGVPVLVGASRKTFLGHLLADARGAPDPVAPTERDDGTLATTMWAIDHGAVRRARARRAPVGRRGAPLGRDARPRRPSSGMNRMVRA